jgi:hypothetical protein
MFVKNKLLWLPKVFVESLFDFDTGWQILANGTGASLTITRKVYEMQSIISNKSSDNCIGVFFERCRHWNLLLKKPHHIERYGGVVP